MHKQQTKTFWFTGKGGVGKSSIASYCAITLSKQGYKTLLIESCDIPASDDFFNIKTEHKPKQALENLSVVNIDKYQTLFEAFGDALGSTKLANILLSNNAIKRFLRAAPGSGDMGLMYSLYSYANRSGYDYVIIDMPAFGHAYTLINIVGLGLKLFRAGPIHDLLSSISSWIKDPERSEMMLVSIPEELPCLETVDFFPKMKELELTIRSVILNQVVSGNDKQLPDSNIPDEIKRLIEIKEIREEGSRKWKSFLEEKLPLKVKNVSFISDNSFGNLMNGLENTGVKIDDILS